MSELLIKWLDPNRQKVFSDLINLSPTGTLGGGTALALQLGHRQSFDFDVFLDGEIPASLFPKISQYYGTGRINLLSESAEELSLLVDNEIKLTFLYCPFPPLHPKISSPSIPLLNVKDIAADKAYTIGRRPAYRDYVDLYFILNGKFANLKSIITDATKRFQGAYNEKLFLEQLVYFKDLKDLAVTFLTEPVAFDDVQNYFARLTKEYLSNNARPSMTIHDYL